MNYLFIILPGIAIVTMVGFYILTRNAQEIKEEKPLPKFQPRKVVDLSTPSSIPPIKEDVTPVSTEEKLAPKRKKKRYYNKKKKSTIANNAQVEKRPVGRPRKTTE
jgi:hypothetical protein